MRTFNAVIAIWMIWGSVNLSDDPTTDWDLDVSGGTVTIDAGHKKGDTTGRSPGQAVSGSARAAKPVSQATAPAKSRGQVLDALAKLTPDQMCNSYFGSNSGTAYYEVNRMSGPLAEYCENRTKTKAQDEAREAVQPQMTIADLGLYVHDHAQSLIDGGSFEIQPASPEIIINKDIYFHSTAVAYTGTVTVFNTPLELHFTPVTFEWHQGDGSSFTTADAGGTYPDGNAKARYQRPGQFVPSVNIGWQVSIRAIGSNEWYPVPGSAVTTTASTPITAIEAEAVLTANR